MNQKEVLHHTTMNLEKSVFESLVFLAQNKNISVTTAIRMLMKLVSEEMEHQKMPKRLIQYQRLPEDSQWHIFHIRLTIEEYEHYVDMRKFFKKSVSYLVAYAVETYGSLLFNTLSPRSQTGEKRDKDIFSHYSFSRELRFGVEVFVISWGPKTRYLENSGFQ